MNLLQHVSRLHCLTDNIALLDMLCAFASVACLSGGQYVRPKMTEYGPLAIVEGRHVLLENRDNDFQVLEFSVPAWVLFKKVISKRIVLMP